VLMNGGGKDQLTLCVNNIQQNSIGYQFMNEIRRMDSTNNGWVFLTLSIAI
jgi:hypothetical protein